MNKKLYALSLIALLFAGNVIVANNENIIPKQKAILPEQTENNLSSALEKAKVILQSKAARTVWAATKLAFGIASAGFGVITHYDIAAEAKNSKSNYFKYHCGKVPRAIFTEDTPAVVRILAFYCAYPAVPLGIYALYSGSKDIKDLYFSKQEATEQDSELDPAE